MRRFAIVLFVLATPGLVLGDLTGTEGLAIDLSSAGAGTDFTIAFDPTEITGGTTWDDGGEASVVWTWNLAAGDPAVTFGNGVVNVSSGTLQQGGTAVLLSTAIGTTVQAYDADLTTYAGITPSANIQSLLGSADYATARTNLGLAIGTNVQAYDADLTTYAGITPSADVQTLLGYANLAAIKGGLSIDDLVTLSGVVDGSVNLGEFTGTTISDNQTLKAAIQALETALEAVPAAHDAVTLDPNMINLFTLTSQAVEVNLATPTNGNTEALSTADQIYDFVIGLGYEEDAHAAEHAVGAADTTFPADPGADRYLMWDDDPGALVWAEAGTGSGDMLKTTYDVSGDGFVDGNDVAYAAAWNGDVNAPSMNAVYDAIEALHDAVTVDSNMAAIFTLTSQAIEVNIVTPTDGRDDALSTSDDVYDFVTGQGYLTVESDPAVATHESTYDHSDLHDAMTLDPNMATIFTLTSQVVEVNLATPTDGRDDAFATSDDVYDFVTGQGYLTVEVDGDTSNEIEVEDEAFSAANFDGATTKGVSQDDFYDLWHGIDTDDDGDIDVMDATVWATKQGADDDLTDLADGSLTASKVAGVADADYGDVTVSTGAWAVENDSHTHNTASISGLDLTGDTNMDEAMVDIDLLVMSGDGVDANTAAVANGDTKHLATGDQIYDFVIALGYQAGDPNLTGIAAVNWTNGQFVRSTGTGGFEGVTANAGTDITADLEEEVTEGSLADSVIVSADIKDGTIAGGDLASNIAITSTGAQDFGGSSDFEIENGTNPTVDTAGEISVDTDEEAIRLYGAAQRTIPALQICSKTIWDPDAVQATEDAIPLLFVADDWAPFGITIKDIHLGADASNSAAVVLEEWSNPTTASSDIESVSFSAATTAEDDGTLSDAAVAANSWVFVDLDTTDLHFLTITFTYYINAGD